MLQFPSDNLGVGWSSVAGLFFDNWLLFEDIIGDIGDASPSSESQKTLSDRVVPPVRSPNTPELESEWRLMMLDALKAYGFDIPDDELVHDRRLLNPGRPRSKAA